ncbi:MAG: Na+/H+ antiporter subunit E [Oscillospiraceae bacterium]|nr:Na+/H+ antiporter subunit E [Oscillospiraceae bacterium]
MSRNGFFTLLSLTAIWLILMEEISLFTIVSGLVIGLICLWVSRKFIPLSTIQDVRFARLIFYPFLLIWEIYAQGIQVIRLVITGAKADIVQVETKLTSDFLKALLMGSITLTPGSVPLDLEDGTLTVLNLGRKEGGDAQELVDDLAERLEKRLMKAQK